MNHLQQASQDSRYYIFVDAECSSDVTSHCTALAQSVSLGEAGVTPSQVTARVPTWNTTVSIDGLDSAERMHFFFPDLSGHADGKRRRLERIG